MPAERFRRHIKITGNYVGPDDRAHLWFIQNVAQDVSIAVTEHHGFDTAWYRNHGSGWVMRRFEAELARDWTLDDEIVIETWISRRKRVSVHREYRFLDAGTGQTMGGAQAEWVYIDAHTARPTTLPPELDERMAIVPEEAITPWDPPELPADGQCELSAKRAVGYSELDGYGHTNNTTYLRWIADLLFRDGPGDHRIHRWRILYKKPARLGEEIVVNAASSSQPDGSIFWRIGILSGDEKEELVRAYILALPR